MTDHLEPLEQRDVELRAKIAEEIADAIEVEAARMYRDDYRSGKVGIAYVDGFEDAARIAREHAHPEVTG